MEAQMFQIGVNIAFTLISFLGGWILNSLVKRQDNTDARLHSISNKVQGLEVLMAGDYCKKADLDKLGNSIFTKLDQISNKLDNKMDKP